MKQLLKRALLPVLVVGALAVPATPILATSGLSAPAAPDGPVAAPSPGEIVAAAPAGDWIDIPAEDLLEMTLAPDAKGRPRRLVIQLVPAPFSQPWVANMRTLARAHWYDGTAITRVQDNYVAQWGDPEGENPARAKPLPAGLQPTDARDYVASAAGLPLPAAPAAPDAYAPVTAHVAGWPVATDGAHAWPVHCYGSVGVGRGMSPDAGSGAELYAVIGHAPRHLDRNIAIVGRVIEGIEHLSALSRGTGPLGFYETAGERTPVRAIRLASALPASERPRFQSLATQSASFARYADARANRRDPFFVVPAGGADICNVPVPVRRRP